MSSELTNNNSISTGYIPCSDADDISIEEIEDTINQLINDNRDHEFLDDDEKYNNNYDQIYNMIITSIELDDDDYDDEEEDDDEIMMDGIEELKVTIIEKVCILEKFAISLMFSNHENISCPICMNDNININDYSALSCGHSCCNSCMTNTKKCYMCRKEIVQL
jgi:hypothetical protein